MSWDDQEATIAIMGAPGSGKSTFINLVSGSNLAFGYSPQSHTGIVQSAPGFQLNGRRVVLVDMPGFGDPTRSDMEILETIAEFLVTSYNEDRLLTGVLYFHRISDTGVDGASTKNISMFKKLCGELAFSNVMIVTNMWEGVDREVGIAREAEIANDDLFFKPLLEGGSRLIRHRNSRRSARFIIRQALERYPQLLQIQVELVDLGMDISQTSAGEGLNRESDVPIKKYEEIRVFEGERQQAIKDGGEEASGEIEIEAKEMENGKPWPTQGGGATGKPAVNLDASDATIILMGAPGSGKSTFIDVFTESNLHVGTRPRPPTSTVQLTPAFWFEGRRVVMVDTPGFFDAARSDTKTLEAIANVLATSYRQCCPTGILFFHQIADVRMREVSAKNLKMFQTICGGRAFPKVVIVTNTWEQVDRQVGEAREAELKNDASFFKTILEKGAHMARHTNTVSSAEYIVHLILNALGGDPQPLHIQKELVELHRDISQTSAGGQLDKELNAQIRKHEAEMHVLAEEMERAIRENDEEAKTEMEMVIAKFKDDAQRLVSNYGGGKTRPKPVRRLIRADKQEADRKVNHYRGHIDERKEGDDSASVVPSRGSPKSAATAVKGAVSRAVKAKNPPLNR